MIYVCKEKVNRYNKFRPLDKLCVFGWGMFETSQDLKGLWKWSRLAMYLIVGGVIELWLKSS